MDYYRNPKVIGAFLVGFSLVAGAYVTSNFGRSTASPSNSLTTVAEEAPLRVFIPVADANTDGVEDWQDQFITAPAVSLSTSSLAYTPPTTLTGQIGITLMEDVITALASGPIGKSKEELVADAANKLGGSASSDQIYDVKDITISNDNSDEYIRLYGNGLADVLINESIPGIKNELLLLSDVVADPSDENISQLKLLTNVYKNYRDKTIAIPVPTFFVKEHLDLINVYNAMYHNIEVMTHVTEDPALSFIRLKRYEDDVQGLSLATINMYNALVPYARVFSKTDSALLFVNFNPEQQ